MSTYSLQRFHKAQENAFQKRPPGNPQARKTSHWMVYFPAADRVGVRATAKLYAIWNLEEAEFIYRIKSL